LDHRKLQNIIAGAGFTLPQAAIEQMGGGFNQQEASDDYGVAG
jgi:hypothetical protein